MTLRLVIGGSPAPSLLPSLNIFTLQFLRFSHGGEQVYKATLPDHKQCQVMKRHQRRYPRNLELLYSNSVNRHLCKMDTSTGWTSSVGPYVTFFSHFTVT